MSLAQGIGGSFNNTNYTTTKVDGTEVTWTGTDDTSAKNKMNEALSDPEIEISYKYVGDDESAVPPLTLEKT